MTRRTREIGIRMAIGANRGSVLWLVFRDAITMLFVGALIGGVARAIAASLFAVSAKDPLSLSIAVLSLALTALLASFLPALRAAKVDPVSALRYE